MYGRPGTIRYTNPPALTTRSSPADAAHASEHGRRPAQAASQGGGSRSYLLVVHPFSGLIVRYYAQKYPREAAGMVLVDAFGTNIRRLFGRLWPRYEHLLNFPGTPLENDPGSETVDADRAIKSINNEASADAARRDHQDGAVRDRSRHTEGSDAKARAGWPMVQAALVTHEPRTPHIFATGSGHYVEINDPDLTISVSLSG